MKAPSFISLLVLPAAVSCALAAAPLSTVPMDALEARISDLLEDEEGEFGVYLKVLASGAEMSVGGDEAFFAASCYKIPLAHMVLTMELEGEIDVDQTIVYGEDDRVDGRGTLSDREPGSHVPVRELLELAVVESCNAAGVMLVREVGYTALTEHMADLGAQVVHPTHNLSSPRDLGLFLEHVLALAHDAPGHGRFLLDLMTRARPRNRIPAGLPPGVESAVKPGTYPGITNDMGVVWGPYGTYILTFMSRGLPSAPDGPRVASRVASLVHHHLTRVYPPSWVRPRRVP